jgi:hypothetical protein
MMDNIGRIPGRMLSSTGSARRLTNFPPRPTHTPGPPSPPPLPGPPRSPACHTRPFMEVSPWVPCQQPAGRQPLLGDGRESTGGPIVNHSGTACLADPPLPQLLRRRLDLRELLLTRRARDTSGTATQSTRRNDSPRPAPRARRPAAAPAPARACERERERPPHIRVRVKIMGLITINQN